MELYHLDLFIMIPTTQPLQVPSLDYIYWHHSGMILIQGKVVQYHMKHLSPGTIWNK